MTVSCTARKRPKPPPKWLRRWRAWRGRCAFCGRKEVVRHIHASARDYWAWPACKQCVGPGRPIWTGRSVRMNNPKTFIYWAILLALGICTAIAVRNCAYAAGGVALIVVLIFAVGWFRLWRKSRAKRKAQRCG